MPADSIAWLLMMAWDLSSHGYRNEMRACVWRRAFRVAEINDLRPPYPGDAPLPTQDYAAMYRILGLYRPGDSSPGQRSSLDEVARQLVALQPDSGFGAGPGVGSNNWVVAGDRTVSGVPLLANNRTWDFRRRRVWYFAASMRPVFRPRGRHFQVFPS